MIINSRYTVIEQIGSGVWANVYKVLDNRTGKYYALKLFLHLDAETLYEKFSAYDMYQITHLNHPNLVPVITFGNMGKHIYYIYELTKGQNLQNFRLKMNKLHIFYDMIVQCLYALQALHSQKIYHQDIKPTNILYHITNDNVEVKLIDYGFNKLDHEISQQTISGTLPYIAPELFQKFAPSPQSDFYSLGVTLYKLSTGTLPFSLEQISSIKSGYQHNFFPKFISEIYPEMSPGLEKFILKLIEKNPNDRFPDAQTAISVINKIQSNNYSFSHRLSLIQSVNLNSNITRQEYTNQLIDHIKNAPPNKGKILSLIGGYGVGKNGILTLLKYHFFTDNYIVFEYTCSAKQKDPFFALMKEFSTSVLSNKNAENLFDDVSPRLKRLIESDDEEFSTITGDASKTQRDFITGERFLDYLSDEKPIIYIIRDAQNLTKETIAFINFLAPLMTRKPIFIITSANDPSKLKDITYKIPISVEALSTQQTHDYIKKLLNTEPPEKFVNDILYRSSGNPYFIKEMLVDLLQKKLLLNKKNQVDFDVNFQDYFLPDHLLNILMVRIKNIDKTKSNYVKSLSIFNTTITRKMIKEILNVSEKRLFEFLQDTLNYEILRKDGANFEFTLPEIKQFYLENCLNSEITDISKKLIQHFHDNEDLDIDFYKGIIKNAEYISDFAAIRRFRHSLFHVYSQRYDQIQAFNEIYKIIELDLSNQILVSSKEIRKDLLAFIDKANLSGFLDNALNLLLSFERDFNLFEWYYALAHLYMRKEDFQTALNHLDQATPLIKEEQQRAMLRLDRALCYIRIGELNKANDILTLIDPEVLEHDLLVQYYDRYGLYLRALDRLEDAIVFYEECIPKLEIYPTTKKGSLYNNLGVCYTEMKMYEEAEKALFSCKEEWEGTNNFRSLGFVYTNLGDMYLCQGETRKSFEYIEKAEYYARRVGNQRLTVVVYNNYGEVFIKMGKFLDAAFYLYEGKNLLHSLANHSIEKDLNNNLALSLHKTKNYYQYYKFLDSVAPNMLENIIVAINPMVRSYIFYLFELGDKETIESIIYSDFNLTKINEQDFYYQVLAMLSILKGDYHTAVNNYLVSLEYVQKAKNLYALAISYINLAIAYCNNNETDKATEFLDKALPIVKENDYLYWEVILKITRMQIACLKKEISLREILREAFALLPIVKHNNYFKLEIEIYIIIIHIYIELEAFKYAQAYYNIYAEKVRDAVRNLPEKDQKRYITLKKASLKKISEFQLFHIVSRARVKPVEWNQEILQLLRLEDSERIKFFLDVKIHQYFSPFAYAILTFKPQSVVKSLSKTNYTLYLQRNFDENILSNKEITSYANKAINDAKIVTFIINSISYIICPIQLKYSKIGVWILQDNGEMPFSAQEQKLMQTFSFHLSTMLIRLSEFEEENQKIALMKELMSITGKMMQIYEMDKLEQNILQDAIRITKSTRGFLIKKDKQGNYFYSVALDNQNNILTNVSNVSNSIVHEVQTTGHPILLEDFFKNKTKMRDTTDALEIQSNSLYCVPIIVEQKIYGVLYLDNYPQKHTNLKIIADMMDIFLIHVQLALLNAQTYQSLMAKNMELLTLDTMKNKFLSIVSHELNTPLFSLQEHIQKLKRTVETSDNETSDSLSKADGSLRRLHKIINDIITLNRYNRSNFLRKETVKPADLLTPIYNEVKSVSSERKMNIKLEISENTPFLYVEPESTQILIKNLLFNAIRFTPDYGTIILGVRNAIFPAEKIEGHETVVIYVQDNGMGIPEKEQANIFKAFYELGDIYSHRSGFLEFRSGGLGVGLAIAHRIIELHQGKIWPVSKLKEGTTIFVSLPAD